MLDDRIVLAIPIKKLPGRAIFIVLGALFVLLHGAMYYELRKGNALTLVPLSLTYKFGPFHRFMARQELWRQIRAGDTSGAGALSMALTLSTSEYFDSEQALELAEELIDYGVDVNSKNGYGSTPLQWAINLVEPTSVEFLLEHCADPGVVLTFSPDGAGTKTNALEIAFLMEKEYPDRDYASVIAVLEPKDLGRDCKVDYVRCLLFNP